MTLIPTIDEGACSGHGDCVAIAPQVFALGETAPWSAAEATSSCSTRPRPAPHWRSP